jgi:hypothetical protein
MHVFVGRFNSFHRNVVVKYDPVEETIKVIRIPAGYEQPAAIRVNFRLYDGILLKNQRSNE